MAEPRDGRLGLTQLVGEDLADAVHRLRRGVAVLPPAQERLDLGQAEAHVLQLLDPLDPRHRPPRVQPEAPLRPDRRRQQPELFVEVDRADGLARLLRELSDFQEREAFCRYLQGISGSGVCASLYGYADSNP